MWAELYGSVASTRQSVRLERESIPMGRWFDVHAFPVAVRDETCVGILFSDVTEKRILEHKLRESEIRYRSALRVGRIGSWETDFVKGERTWSDEGMALFGIDLPGGIGHVGGPQDEWRHTLHPDDRDIPEAIYAHLATNDTLQVRYRIRRPGDGTVLSLLGHAEVVARDELGRVRKLLNVVADVTQLAETERALRASEARFRAIQETSIDGFMVFESVRAADGTLVDFRWTYANEAAERIVGKPRSWFLGRLLLAEMPGNRDDGLFDAYVRVAETGVPWTKEFNYHHEGLDIHVRAVCAKADDGFAVSFADLTERRRAEDRLRESEARLASALAAGQLGVHDYDPGNGEIKWDAAVRKLWGVSADEPITFEVFAAGVHPEDRDRVMSEVGQALAPGAGRYVCEYRVIHRVTGETRWVVADGDVTVDATGTRRLVGTVRDVTALKTAEDQRRLLVEDLNHHVKNTLATVRAIASQTLRGSDVPPAAKAALEGRLMSLAAAHDVLLQEEWVSAGLRDVVTRALAPHVSDRSARLHVEGPAAALDAKSALALTMCLHELATNATKYGALSNADGRVSVTWTVDARSLELRWQEIGGPAVTVPKKRGFGSRLIERVIAGDLNGSAKLSFAPDGVVCVIRATVQIPA
jgi:PAS domain S-box-containing protein